MGVFDINQYRCTFRLAAIAFAIEIIVRAKQYVSQ